MIGDSSPGSRVVGLAWFVLWSAYMGRVAWRERDPDRRAKAWAMVLFGVLVSALIGYSFSTQP